jgi:hypothetical protein
MSDSHGNWWMDAGARWHQGYPPPDWWQADDGRWHPPAFDDPTEETTIDPPAGGAHLARGGRRTNVLEAYRGWPRWAQLAGPVVGTILALGVLGAAATEGLREDDADTTIGQITTTTEPGTSTSVDQATVAPAAPTTGATTTTASVSGTDASTQPELTPTTVASPPAPPPPTTPVPTTSAPTNNDIHPGAPCSPEGSTAVSADGIPLTCTRQKCHGAPYSEPRWRRTTC